MLLQGYVLLLLFILWMLNKIQSINQLLHKNVPPVTIQLYHLNLHILTHGNISKFMK